MILPISIQGVVNMAKTDLVKYCPVCNETKQNTLWLREINDLNEDNIEFYKGYLIHIDPPREDICPYCKKGKLSNSILTYEEFYIIGDVSNKDRNFLNAMIALKEKDPIEYQLKITQFKNELNQKEQIEKQAQEKSSQRKCPKCGGTNFTPVRRKWSVLTGILTNKVDLVCNNCGYKWKP